MQDLPSVLIAGVLLGGIYGLVALGLNLIFGVVRTVNFAQGELVMLSMYGTYWLYTRLGLNPYLAVPPIAVALFLLGLLLQRFVLQPLQDEPMMQIFATFGLLMLLQNLVLGVTGGVSMGIDWPAARQVLLIAGVRVSLVRVVALAALTAITIGLHLFLRDTMPGKAVRAVIQDKLAARAMGINVERAYLLTFGVGAALAGVAGALLTPIFTLSPAIGGNFILAAFAVVVLGGLGSVWGAYLGGLIVGIVETFAGYYIDPALRQAIWFLIFIAVLIVRPSGLLGQVGAEEVGFREQH
ncbi:MAG: branched-chain amino acid ABC transporter permease [Acidisphaera sp.]|nr:branched-chain amino acid ABC transporter permease [Acidisphaera sp.]